MLFNILISSAITYGFYWFFNGLGFSSNFLIIMSAIVIFVCMASCGKADKDHKDKNRDDELKDLQLQKLKGEMHR